MAATTDWILELKCDGFLRRLLQLTRGDTSRRVNAGDVGAELGLPLEETLAIVSRLHDGGELHRCGRLDAPHGPEVHLTELGVRHAERAAA